MLTAQQVYNVARDAGFTPDIAREMTALARRESGWNERAVRIVPTANSQQGPEASFGLWQINMEGSLGPYRRAALGLTSNEELYVPAVNARAAKWLYDLNGGHSRDWYTDRYGSVFGYAEKFNAYLAALPSAMSLEAGYSGSGGGLLSTASAMPLILAAALIWWVSTWR